MAEILACLDHATILRSLSGEGTPEEVERIATHLEGCAGCGAALESLLQQNETAVALRDETAVGEVGNEALKALHSRLARLLPVAGLAGRSEPTVGVSEEESATWLSPASLPGEAALPFLRPPQRPDELGRLERYRILKKLGAGGMGVVFLAEDTQLNRKVALKTMLPAVAQNPSNKERFLREARAAAAIEHPHIVAIFQVGEDNGVPFLAMPFLKGESLEDRLHRTRKIPVGEALRIADGMAEGLAAAHAGGLIHRDIKPGNVWLESRQAGGPFVVKLLDFGLARSQGDDTHLTQSGAIVGTPAFMAPEQARGMSIDGRADLFSLGCVLYAMLTGERPFRGDTTMSLLTALALDTPKAPREFGPDVPPELSDFVMRLLAKRPEGRPASAAEALDELRRLAAAVLLPSAFDITVTDAPRPKPAPVRSRRRLVVAVGLLLAFVGAGAWFFGGTVVRVATNKGELVVEVDDPDIEVTVKQGGATLVDRKKDRTFVLTAKGGEVEFYDPKTEARMLTKKFTLERNGVTVVTAREELAAARKAREVKPDDPVVVVPATKDRDEPFVVVRKGGEKEEFKAIAGVLGDLRDGDAIEVHGNGPFVMGRVEVKGQTIALRAAPGYRPRFVSHQSLWNGDESNVPWITLEDASLSIEGCDFDGAQLVAQHHPRFLRGIRGASFFLRGCRVLNVVALCDFIGPRMEVTDSLVACAQAFAFVGPRCEVLVRNTVVFGCPHGGIDLAGPGGQAVRLENNTFWTGAVIHLSAEVKGVSVTATGNVFDFRSSAHGQAQPVRMRDAKSNWDVDWRPSLRWQGKQNLYLGLGSFDGGEGPGWWPKEKTALATWNKLLPVAEEESREGAGGDRGYAFMKPFALDAVAFRAHLAALAADARKQSGMADVGPDFGLVGPGDAYVRALAAAGSPVARDDLRPEPGVGGAVALRRGGKDVACFRTLAAAVENAKDGDTVELRSDGTFDGVQVPADFGTLTVRAAPGYNPACKSIVAHAGATLILEGIRFGHVTSDGPPGKHGRIARLANCSVERPERDGGSIEASIGRADGKPGEIVNCLFRGRTFFGVAARSRVEVRNSAFTTFDWTVQGDGKAVIDLDRCQISMNLRGTHFGPVALAVAADSNTQETAVSARRTLFDSTGPLLSSRTKGKSKWEGSRNLYRVPVGYGGNAGFSILSLPAWRAYTGSKEEGSAQPDALLFDPLAWALLPGSPGKGAGPGGKDIGANVMRVAPRSARPKAEPRAMKGGDADRKAAEWVLSVGGGVQVNDQDRYFHAAADLPREPFRLTAVSLRLAQKVTDAGLAHLEGCKDLKYLDLNGTKVGDAGLAHLEGCKDLRYIGLLDTQVGDAGLAHLKGCKGLTHLDLQRTKVSDAGLAHFEGCTKGLTHLDLSDTLVSDAGLVIFKDCKHLTHLGLLDTQVSDAGLVIFEGCKGLTALLLGRNKVTDAGLAHFKGCKHLTRLTLAGTGMTDAGLATFEACKGLTDLCLEGTTMTDAGLATFEDCKGLTKLSLGRLPVGDAGLAHFKDCGNLENLSLGAMPGVTDAGLAHFGGCKRLTHVYLGGTPVGDAGLAHFKECRKLSYLHLDGTRVGDAGLAHLQNCENLRALGLERTRVSDAGLGVLTGLPGLTGLNVRETRISKRGHDLLKSSNPKLELQWSETNRGLAEHVLLLGGTVVIATPGKDDARPIKSAGDLPLGFFQVRRVSLAGVKKPLGELLGTLSLLRLAEFDRLESLDLSGTTPGDLAPLAFVVGLRELSVAGAGLNDGSLAAFPKLPALRRLVLDGNAIKGPGLAGLRVLPELVELSLGDPSLTYLLAENLVGLTKLKKLSLAGSPLTDVGVRNLKALAGLTELDLRKTKVTAKGIDALKKALPECNIEWDGAAAPKGK